MHATGFEKTALVPVIPGRTCNFHLICEVIMNRLPGKKLPEKASSSTRSVHWVPARHIILTHGMEEVELASTRVQVMEIAARSRGRVRVAGNFAAQEDTEIFAWVRCGDELIASHRERVSPARGYFVFEFRLPDGCSVTPGRLMFMILDHA
jgi:hypothetical protein